MVWRASFFWFYGPQASRKSPRMFDISLFFFSLADMVYLTVDCFETTKLPYPSLQKMFIFPVSMPLCYNLANLRLQAFVRSVQINFVWRFRQFHSVKHIIIIKLEKAVLIVSFPYWLLYSTKAKARVILNSDKINNGEAVNRSSNV